ncbi:carbon-nitrogen hydrolase family protein [candidate division KSB1 bacterium]
MLKFILLMPIVFLFIDISFDPTFGKKVKVAICQMKCIDSDVNGNLSRIELQVKEASEKGAKAAFFPETAVIGWANPDAYELAEQMPGKFTKIIGNMAKKYNIIIGIGLCEKEGEKIYDSAVLIDSSGEILLKHRKINILSHLMKKPYIPGKKEDITAVDTPIGRIGMMVCADCFIDEHLKIMKDKNPEFVYIPYGWAYPKEGWPEHGFVLIKTVQKASLKIEAPVVGPNLVGEITNGPWKGRSYEGLSTSADKNGIMLVQGRYNKEDVIVFDLPVN